MHILCSHSVILSSIKILLDSHSIQILLNSYSINNIFEVMSR